MNELRTSKTAVVTGAASGIGFAIASKFASLGIQVVLADRDESALVKAATSLSEKGYNVRHFVADVTSEKQVSDLIDFTREGSSTVNILVNSAGGQFTSVIEEFPTETFLNMLHVMLVAPFLTTKYILPSMKKQKFGRIINIASTHGLVAMPGRAAYDAAKHGLVGFTKVTALEGATYGITANALCPGYVDTPMVRNQYIKVAKERGKTLEEVLNDAIATTPQRRFLEPEEVADYAAFIASEQAKGVTGQAVVIDGGYVAQ